MLLKNYTHSASTALGILDDFGAEVLLGASWSHWPYYQCIISEATQRHAKFTTSRLAWDITGIVQGLMRDSESKGCFQGVCDFSTFQHVTCSMTVRHWLYWRKWGDFACFTQTFANGVVQDKCQNLFYCDLFVEGLPGMFATSLVSPSQSSNHQNISIICPTCEAMTPQECQLPTVQRSHERKRCFVAAFHELREGSPSELCVLVDKVDYDFATLHIPTILFPVSSLCFTLEWLQALPIIAFLYHIIFGRLFWNCCLPALWLEVSQWIQSNQGKPPRRSFGNFSSDTSCQLEWQSEFLAYSASLPQTTGAFVCFSGGFT